MRADSGVDIQIESWFETLPQTGYAPVAVRIRNSSGQAHTWKFSSSNSYGMGGGLSTSQSLRVEPGRSGTMTVFAPVNPDDASGYRYGALNFVISGHGVQSASAGMLHQGPYSGSTSTEFIGMGRRLSNAEWSNLRSRLQASGVKGKPGATGMSLMGSELDMSKAPEDWRGYAALAQLWMDESEWLALRPAAKAAMFDWIAMGGQAFVLAREATEARAQELALPPAVDGRRFHGAGEVRLMGWNGKNLPLAEMDPIIRNAGTNGKRQQLGGFSGKWQMRDLIGELTLNAGLIFGFIVIFGLVVGPVNLFWLAPAGRRQRMFWTTPLISMVGGLVLLAVMIFQDGTGGQGGRMTLVIMQPAQKRSAVLQEQVSRTGVLLARSFPVTENSGMTPLRLAVSAVFSPVRDARYHYVEGEGGRSGDWFSSRAVQAHLLQAVRPGRAAVEFFAAPDGASPPSVLCSFETALSKVFVVDDKNQVWTCDDVGTGEKKVLSASTKSALEEWLNQGPKKLAGPVVSTALAKFEGRPGIVFATGSEPAKLAVPTLASIRWVQDHAVIAGPYTAGH